MTRRDAVIKMALLMGASAVGPRLLSGSFGLTTPQEFRDADIALLDEIGETIIPETHIPGAKAAGIGAFAAMMVTDCYATPAQTAFKVGLAQLPADYASRYGENFIGGTKVNRIEFLNALDLEQCKYTVDQRRKTPADPESELVPHYFRMMRELALLGYFTSEIGQTRALRYLEVPGRYDGNVPYKRGDEWYI